MSWGEQREAIEDFARQLQAKALSDVCSSARVEIRFLPYGVVNRTRKFPQIWHKLTL